MTRLSVPELPEEASEGEPRRHYREVSSRHSRWLVPTPASSIVQASGNCGAPTTPEEHEHRAAEQGEDAGTRGCQDTGCFEA